MPQTFANVTAHDGAVWNDDCVELFLQAADWKEYAHFIVNSLGTQYDEMGRGGRDWNPEWTAKAERKVYDWTVDIEIPYASLGVTPAEGDVWKFNVCRCRKAVAELSSWSPSPSCSFHDVASFGRMVYLITSYPINIKDECDLHIKDNHISYYVWTREDGRILPIKCRIGHKDYFTIIGHTPTEDIYGYYYSPENNTLDIDGGCGPYANGFTNYNHFPLVEVCDGYLNILTFYASGKIAYGHYFDGNTNVPYSEEEYVKLRKLV